VAVAKRNSKLGGKTVRRVAAHRNKTRKRMVRKTPVRYRHGGNGVLLNDKLRRMQEESDRAGNDTKPSSGGFHYQLHL
jgi:hypothetical protein